jgi:hypothetical protein
MSEPKEIHYDIAGTLLDLLPEDQITDIQVGPETPMLKPPTIYCLGCNEGRNVVYKVPAEGTGKAYDCEYDGENQAAMLADETVNSVNADEIPIKISDGLGIADDIFLSMVEKDRDDVSIEIE